MNIIVIEDEKLASDDLVDLIKEIEPSAGVVAVLRSVKEAVAYLSEAPSADLIFSDIQLGDGLSFDIFKKVPISTPIVFCTAYDEYTLNAFKTNGIAYVLKPFTAASIRLAIEKFKSLQKAMAPSAVPYSEILKLLGERPVQKTSSILVHYKEKIIPVKLDDIALFYIRNEITHLLTFDKKTYLVSKTLDEVERLSEGMFFRANRQFLVNRKAVVDASNYLSRKFSISLTVPFSETITVSKEKMPQFLTWLAE
ncbi:LytTR family DNA-binding domain-containing protein [Ravibacter arvi]|uniref:LytTR family DNA-binding domain-containing protein n=1 Tax=Ravibacter arvi TaxID=2051041 RepID=A0ABP8LN18_9BACT